VSAAGSNAAGTTTYAIPGNSTSGNSQSSRAIPTQSAPQQAAIVTGSTFVGSNPLRSAPAEPELVAVSQLTRTNYVPPEYPRGAQRRNVSGSVEVTFTVTTDGKVRSPSVLRSEPGETFDEAAIDAVTQWRFEPVIENGVAVEKRTAVRMAFNLE